MTISTSRAGAELGRIKTKLKAITSARNGKLGGRPPLVYKWMDTSNTSKLDERGVREYQPQAIRRPFGDEGQARELRLRINNKTKAWALHKGKRRTKIAVGSLDDLPTVLNAIDIAKKYKLSHRLPLP